MENLLMTEKGNRINWPDVGRVCQSRGVFDWLNEIDRQISFAATCWQRYIAGDWGDLDDEDKATNDAALFDGSRILAAYRFQGRKVWIITEAENDNRERKYTTILFPSEY